MRAQPGGTTIVLAVLALAAAPAAWLAANVPETEPNDTPATADELPTASAGDWGGPAFIGDATYDEDWWKVSGAATGGLLFAYINTDDPFNDGQPWMIAYADDGSTVVEARLPSRIAGAVVPQDGDVYLHVREQSNNDDLRYAVLQYVGPAWDQGAEVEPNNTRGQATPITAGVMTGAVAGSDVDTFSFTVDNPANTWVTVIVDNDPDDDGDDTQTVLDLVDTTGASVAHRADGYLSPSNIAEMYSVPYMGTFYLTIGTDVWSEDTDYRFVLLIGGASASPPPIFVDGFESGSASQWTAIVP